MGPAWFSSVMGTGILSNLLGRHIHAQPWLIVPSAFLLGVGALLLTLYTYSYCARWIKTRTTFAANATCFQQSIQTGALFPWDTCP